MPLRILLQKAGLFHNWQNNITLVTKHTGLCKLPEILLALHKQTSLDCKVL